MHTENNAHRKTTRLRVGLLATAELRSLVNHATVPCKDAVPELPPDDENNYWAEAIQDGKEFYYRVGDVTVPITAEEYRRAIAHPTLHYFSAALKLHLRVGRVRAGLPAID